MNRLIKIILACLLLSCLLPIPYGYFQLVRFISAVGFILLSINAEKENGQTEKIKLFILAILFQPLFKISLGRLFWNIIDVIVAVGLLLTLSNMPKSNQK
jgi:hypothetical protein